MKTRGSCASAQARSASKHNYAASVDDSPPEGFWVLQLYRADCDYLIQSLEGLTLLQERLLVLLLCLSRWKGYAWMRQSKMAFELRSPLRTLQAAIAWAKEAGYLQVERVGINRYHYHLDLVMIGLAQGPRPAGAAAPTRRIGGRLYDPPSDLPAPRAAAEKPAVENEDPPPPPREEDVSQETGYDGSSRAAATSPESENGSSNVARDDVLHVTPPLPALSREKEASRVSVPVENLLELFGVPEDEPPPRRSATMPTDLRRRGGAVPGLKKAREPKPDFEASLGLVRKVKALPGGGTALYYLERAALPLDLNDAVLRRVIEYDDHIRGLDNAGKFIHGPIRDARNLYNRRQEQLEAAIHLEKTARRAIRPIPSSEIPPSNKNVYRPPIDERARKFVTSFSSSRAVHADLEHLRSEVTNLHCGEG